MVTPLQANVPENTLRGIAWMLGTMFWFVTLDATAKYLMQSFSVVQVLWGRFFFHTLLVALFMGARLPYGFTSRRFSMQFSRSILMLATTVFFFIGIARTPLATASTIMFLSPIFVTLLAIPFLGEMIGPRRWAGIVLGFIGALIVVRPDWGGLEIGLLSVLCAALTNASYQIVTRKVRVYDSPMTSLFYTGIVGAIAMTIVVPFYWQSPSAFAWLLLVLLGVAGSLGHLCLIRALRLAPASTVVPFSYTALIWATLYGYVLFASLPDRYTLLGAALIMGSGLYIFYREQQLVAEKIGSQTL